MKVTLGVDIGGQGMKMRADCISEIVRDKELTKETILSNIKKFMQDNELQDEISGIGISIAGIVDNNTLKKGRDALIGFRKDDLASLGIENIFIINDGEAHAWAAKKKYNKNNVVALVAGTGIGCGIIVDNKPLRGSHWESGEIHNIPMETNEGLVSLGNLCAGTAVVKRLGLEYMLQRMQDLEVQAEIQKAGHYMGIYAIIVKRLLDPEVIYITGGATSWKGYFEAAKKTYLKGTESLAHTSIEVSEDYFYDGCTGAAYYAELQAKEKMS